MEAKYDGWCTACGSAVHAGDEIVSEGGDWVHEECADDAFVSTVRVHRDPMDAMMDDALKLRDRSASRLARSLNVPVEILTGDTEQDVAPQPPYKSPDRWDRYVLTHPGDPGRKVTATRCTTLIKAADDPYNLGVWQKGNVALGLAKRSDLLAVASTLTQGDPKLKELVKSAEEAGGGSVKANLGTALHGFTEMVDRGRPITDVPEAHRRDIVAYREAVSEHGLSVVPQAIERITLTSLWDGLAGTFDRVYRLPDGSYVMGDVKSGKIGYDPKVIYAQLAMYARGFNETGVYDVANERWERLPIRVREDVALIVHLPAGEGVCRVYRATAEDMNLGRAHLGLCTVIRKHRKVRPRLVPYVAGAVVQALPDDRHRAEILATTTRNELMNVGRMLKADGFMTPELRALAMAHRETLAG